MSKCKRESDLFPAVRRWLEARGWTVHVEVFDCDVVATRDGQIVAVELKRGLTSGLRWQAQHRTRWADFVYVAIPASCYQKRDSGLAYHGIGVLVIDGDIARERMKARPQPWHFHKTRPYRLKALARRGPAAPHERGGLHAVELGRQTQARRAAE